MRKPLVKKYNQEFKYKAIQILTCPSKLSIIIIIVITHQEENNGVLKKQCSG